MKLSHTYPAYARYPHETDNAENQNACTSHLFTLIPTLGTEMSNLANASLFK